MRSSSARGTLSVMRWAALAIALAACGGTVEPVDASTDVSSSDAGQAHVDGGQVDCRVDDADLRAVCCADAPGALGCTDCRVDDVDLHEICCIDAPGGLGCD